MRVMGVQWFTSLRQVAQAMTTGMPVDRGAWEQTLASDRQAAQARHGKCPSCGAVHGRVRDCGVRDQRAAAAAPTRSAPVGAARPSVPTATQRERGRRAAVSLRAEAAAKAARLARASADVRRRHAQMLAEQATRRRAEVYDMPLPCLGALAARAAAAHRPARR